MWRNLAAVCAVGLLTAASVRADVTLESLLKEMVDYGAVARWPQPEFTCKQASSYDRGTVAPDKPGWFANNDQNQFIRTEENQGRKERVMLDADGPGCIVRFWLTTDRNKKGTLRIYLDGAEESALAFPAYDLLSGDLKIGPPLVQPHPGYRPDANGGNNFYLPIPYAKHCKITWEEAGQSSRYYQINYRTYAPGTAVQTFTRGALEAARPVVERVNKVLLAPPDELQGRTIASEKEIAAGAEQSLELPPGPSAVRRLELRVFAGQQSRSERALRSLVLQMSCDGEPTVWCPVSDFFGSGVGLNRIESWYRKVEPNGTMICRWVMPYQKSARLTLLNLAEQPIRISLRATVSPWSWDDRSMHFHAVWHHEAGLKTPPHRDWNFVKVAGRGVYVGDTLALFNPVATWYGEGDEKIWVDGESFPSHVGTGTEDYYGYSYAPKPVHNTPFCGEPRLDQAMTQGHSTSTRTRNLDGIPFRRSLQFDMELISWKPTTLTYAATTYWYALPVASSNVQPQPRDAALPVPTLAEAIAASVPPRKPGAVECETMKVLAKAGDFFVGEQDMEPFGGDRWSKGRHLLGKTAATGNSVEIEWPAPDAAPRKLVLYATQAPDYATLRFSVNGQAVPATFDGYADSVQPGPAFPLGGVRAARRQVHAPRRDRRSQPRCNRREVFLRPGLHDFGETMNMNTATKDRPVIIGLGEVLWDLLPAGKQLGGAPANFAYHAHALGAEALVVSRVGNDAQGREILARLSGLCLRTDGITTDPSAPTGTVSVTLDAQGHPSYIIHENAAWDFLEAGQSVLREAAQADAICFGTLGQRNPVARAAIREVLKATPPTALRIFDINLRQQFWSRELIVESLELAEVLKLNDEELPIVARLLELKGEECDLLRQLASAYELRAIALTKGAKGSTLLADGEIISRPGSMLTVADTVGAGDSYTASLALGLLAGHAPEQIIRFAHRVADHVCTQPGATPPMPEPLRRHFAPQCPVSAAA